MMSSIEKEQDAVYVGMQPQAKGKPPVPLFDVIKKGHSIEGSTVTIESLILYGLRIPSYPCSSDLK